MCGIAGIVGKHKININIRPVLEKIRHRGPDGLFYWENDVMALGHARLKIIDLSNLANQPMIDPSSGNVLIFNGEIYNYKEIKKEIADKYHFITHSDTETILAAYQVYGISFLQKLQGMFAFALFDRSKNRLLIARDRVGIKPFYYRSINGAFMFASEIKAIINHTAASETLNTLKTYEFLANRQLDTNEDTLFEGVKQFRAGHYGWVDMEGNLETVLPYWGFGNQGNEKFNEAAKKEFIQLFDDTIQLHLRSDVAVGAFVSGGIDSSSVACFAVRNMQQHNLHTFSGVLPYKHPENALIEDVLASSNAFIPHKFLLDGKDFFDDIEDVIYHHDEPLLDGSMYAHYKLCQFAANEGIKVLLSGSGGDELFGGYGSYINSQHARLLANGKMHQYIKSIQGIVPNSTYTYKNLIAKSLYETFPLKLRKLLKNQQLRNRNKHLESTPYIAHYHHSHPDPYYSNMLNNYKSWTVPAYLHYEDRNSMAFGVEIRVPFYDHRLMDFVFRFSPDEIIKHSSKSILRNSFKGIVPAKVLEQQGKFGFPSPIDHALIQSKKGKELFFDLLHTTPLLKKKETTSIGKDFYAGKNNLTTYWRLLSYMLWYNIFFTNRHQNP